MLSRAPGLVVAETVVLCCRDCITVRKFSRVLCVYVCVVFVCAERSPHIVGVADSFVNVCVCVWLVSMRIFSSLHAYTK